MDIKIVKKLVLGVIEDNNTLLPEEKKISLDNKSLRDIDSLQLVNLIIAIEEKVADEFEINIVISLEEPDHQALDSIDNFCIYLLKLIEK